MAAFDEYAGAAPLKVSFSSRGSKDLDEDDVLRFNWSLEGNSVRSSEPHPDHTFTRPGIYHVVLKVTDQHDLSTTDTVVVKVGNTRPAVNIVTKNNKSFFWRNKPFRYSVQVVDKEDAHPDPGKISVTFDYNPDPGVSPDPRPIVTSKLVQGAEPLSPGFSKIMASDCKACHTADSKSVGPS